MPIATGNTFSGCNKCGLFGRLFKCSKCTEWFCRIHFEWAHDLCTKCQSETLKPTKFAVETRECKGCVNFRDPGMMEMKYCKKKLMGVSASMKVGYLIKDGTCFEEKETTNRES